MRRLVALVLACCTPGPAYHRPSAPAPATDSWKEWKPARPSDRLPRGRWWTMFHEPELDKLEARVEAGNQPIAQAIASYEAAVAQIRSARAAYYPTLSTAPSANTAQVDSQKRTTAYRIPLSASWAPDLFGRVRTLVAQRRYTAQAQAADLANTRLLQHALLAQLYFELRGQDALVRVLESAVKTDEGIVELTRASYEVGIGNEASVVQAQQTLQAARVQLTNAGILRGQDEHAIATVLGVAPSGFSLPVRAHLATPPIIPVGTPSRLLERRPDIAAAERAMAAANAAIGSAYAAYYPTLDLSADAALASGKLAELFRWSNFAWSLAATLGETIFDGGARAAVVDITKAEYRATVASYRQTVLTAFQQVEDQLVALRILATEIAQQRTSVELARRGLELERARYAEGLDPYVTLMTQQIVLLQAEQTLVALQVQQLVAAVQLIQDLGGGWDVSKLPSP